MAISLQKLDLRAKSNVRGQKHILVLQMGPAMIIFYFIFLWCGIIAAFSENSSATTEGNEYLHVNFHSVVLIITNFFFKFNILNHTKYLEKIISINVI